MKKALALVVLGLAISGCAKMEYYDEPSPLHGLWKLDSEACTYSEVEYDKLQNLPKTIQGAYFSGNSGGFFRVMDPQTGLYLNLTDAKSHLVSMDSTSGVVCRFDEKLMFHSSKDQISVTGIDDVKAHASNDPSCGGSVNRSMLRAHGFSTGYHYNIKNKTLILVANTSEFCELNGFFGARAVLVFKAQSAKETKKLGF